mmetsp:Transcript_21834/g.62206  ORF Transcript_21834/g.62206 Transcript_21834/m.62206 type:complete len:212 (-) Transcript_21834:716-1351(-)
MPPHAGLIDAQRDAELSHFVLEQLAQRFDQLELHGVRQPADVVVRLDRRRWTLVRNRLDDVRVERALEKVLAISVQLLLDLVGLLLEHLNEGVADDFALPFRLRDTLQLVQEPIGSIHASQIHAAVLAHSLQHLRGLILAKASVVHQHGVEPIADGARHEHGGNGGIDSTADGANHMMLTDLGTHGLDEFFGVIGHHPILLGSGDLDAKVL